MSPEDKGSAMSSLEGAPAGKSDEGTSLAARRARLRGSLAKHAAPPDPYSVASPVGDPPADEAKAKEAPDEKESSAASQSTNNSQTTTEEEPMSKETTTEPSVPVNNRKSSQAAQAQAAAQAAQATQAASDPQAPASPPAPPSPSLFTQPESPAVPEYGDRPFTFTFDEVAKEKPSDMSNNPNQSSVFVQEPVGEILNNIDQGLSACAMNLANLQKLAGEQTEALKSLSETLQNQTFAEIGLTLNSLMESLSAALEPMKAVSELVPAIDSLVTMLENKESSSPEGEKMSPDQLVMSLADQLSAGIIDPWTFKCAYMAVYPAEHPADLLHRLVDLLGTQRISGDLFRAAYDAVQGAEAPVREFGSDSESGGTVRVVQDPNVAAELERIRKSHEELSGRFEQRERELQESISQKDQELEEQKQLLTSRWEEFNARYDELSETLHKRDEMLEQKESELSRRDQEITSRETVIQQLKAQLEEMQEQAKDMAQSFQKQIAEVKSKKEEAPVKPQSSFFDVAPQPQTSPNLFDAAPPKPLFEPQPQAAPQQQPLPEPVNQTLQMPQQPVPVQPPQPVQPPPMPPEPPPAQPVQEQAIPRPPATTPFVSGPGSYGSGVRAQVFEVIVRQALAGAPWREICAGPMQVNNITPEEVEAEVKRRQALLKK